MGMGVGWAWAALLASSCDVRLSSVATAAQTSIGGGCNRLSSVATAAQTVQKNELEGSANYTRAAVHARRAGAGRGGRAGMRSPWQRARLRRLTPMMTA